MREHLVDGVLVEEPLVHGRRLHALWRRLVLGPLELVPLLLLVLREVGVRDPLSRELDRDGDGPSRHEEAVLHRLLEAVVVGRHAALEVEETVRVDVDLVLRRRRQADEE